MWLRDCLFLRFLYRCPLWLTGLCLLGMICVPVGSGPVSAAAKQTRRPNVILIMTDDQGYGDAGCLGNRVIRTPHIDSLYAESVRLTNYHVDPTCSPTRSALLTGRYSSRTGVWHTIMGRSLMHPGEVTLGEVFAANGYRTGLFGKWHLGDNYPCRPQDQGFQEVLVHGGGGVTQTPDYWGNDYFDDTYWHNGKPKAFRGYCTDVFFDGALQFIEANRDRPFFVYLPTNAAHGPYRVAPEYSEPYKKMGVPSPRAEFYGMITNIDDNLARLRKRLRELKLEKNTILIFTTDNGTAAGIGSQRRGKRNKTGKGKQRAPQKLSEKQRQIRFGYNAGMRGKKGSEYDGGHRVPFFIYWPEGKLTGGKDISQLTAHIDVLPTLAELCGCSLPKSLRLDGRSLVPLLKGTAKHWPSRTLFVHSQRLEFPQKWRKAAVMTDRWRLVLDGSRRELFDMKDDPGQQDNVATKYPEVEKKLTAAYEKWYADIGERFGDYVRITLGAKEENPARLTCHDWHTHDKPVPWHQGHIRNDLTANGYWAVHLARAGTYEFTLRTRPAEVKAVIPSGTARLKIGPVDESQPVPAQATGVTFRVTLPAGNARLQTWLPGRKGGIRGAYFVEVRFVK